VYARAAAEHGLDIAPAEAEQRFVAAWRSTQSEHQGLIYGRTHAEARLFWFSVLRKCFANDAAADDRIALLRDDLYSVFGRATAWTVRPGWIELIAAAQAHGIRVGLISNWDVRLRPLLAELGLLAGVDSCVISAERGLEKPHPEIFRLALTELSALPAETMHVGDTWLEDVEGARAAGMVPVWFNPEGRPRPEPALEVREVHAPQELLAFLVLLP
jgi:putative hydrolase of the HAD superfamily